MTRAEIKRITGWSRSNITKLKERVVGKNVCNIDMIRDAKGLFVEALRHHGFSVAD